MVMSTLTQTAPSQTALSHFLPNNMQIPVIRNVITDEELVKLKDASNPVPPLLHQSGKTHLAKILKLMTDKHSKNLVDRHARAITKLSTMYTYGVHLEDITILLKLMQKCHENVSVDSIYEDLVCTLVKLLSKPFLKSKVSDEETFLIEVSRNINELGSIAEVSSDKVKVAVSNTLTALYTSKEHAHKFSDCRPVSKMFISSIVGKSEICKSLAECMSHVSDCESRYILMKCLNNLSDSSVNVNDMLKAEVAACICNNFNSDMYIYKLLFVDLETLWNILDYGDHNEVARQLTSIACLTSLRLVFINQMSACTSYADRQLRNDVVVIISLIASKYPSAPFVESGLAKTLSLYCAYPEVPSKMEKLAQVKLTPSPEDFELKKLFLNIIAILCNNRLCVRVMSKNHVILALFSYVVPIKETNETIWTLSEFEELQLQALAVLSILSPLCVEDYSTCHGNARLLAMLDWCVSTDLFRGHGNSFYGIGGQGNKRAQMRLCIRVLRNMCSTGKDEVCQDLTDQGLISQLVAILLSCSSCVESNDVLDVEIQCDMLFILSSLCEGNYHRKLLFGEEGLKMTLQYLQCYINATKALLAHHKLVLSTIDCLLSVVVGCYTMEIDFLKREGAFVLLDLLEICPENMKNIVLVLLADLLDNNNVPPHLMMWRGNNEMTVAKLLIHIWSMEEKRLGVCRDGYGVITDISRPLLTCFQENEGVIVSPSTSLTPAIIDVSDNLRSKIYGVFCKIGFNNLVGLESADYIMLSVIEKYLDFKTLEVWQEVRRELEMEKVEPISIDTECMDEAIFILQSKALTVTIVQKALIQSNFEQAITDEKDFFERIKETYKQDEKSYEDFMSYIRRTSDYGFLKKAKQEQMKSIDCSRLSAKPPGKALIHRTMDRSLQTTTFCGRHLRVVSTNFNTIDASSTSKK